MRRDRRVGAGVLVLLICSFIFFWSRALVDQDELSCVKRMQSGSVPKSVLSGVDLMEMGVHPASRVGLRIVHQSWKTLCFHDIRMQKLFDSWTKHHFDALHVLWSDRDNLALVSSFYPEFLSIQSPSAACPTVRLCEALVLAPLWRRVC